MEPPTPPFFTLRQGLTKLPRLILNLQSCLSLSVLGCEYTPLLGPAPPSLGMFPVDLCWAPISRMNLKLRCGEQEVGLDTQRGVPANSGLRGQGCSRKRRWRPSCYGGSCCLRQARVVSRPAREDSEQRPGSHCPICVLFFPKQLFRGLWGREWWRMLVIPATREAKAEDSKLKTNLRNLARPCFKTNHF